MELVLVRHGEPQWSVDGMSQNDPALTDRGHQQATFAADWLATQDEPPTEALSSPALRAMQTAQPLADALAQPVEVVEGLAEIGMPDWSTTPESEVRALFRDAQQRHPTEWWQGMDGGEPFTDFHKRVSTTITDVLAERGAVALEGADRHLWRYQANDRRKIAVFAHAGTNTAILNTLLHIDPTPWEWDRFALGHASITRIRLIPLGSEHVFSLRGCNERDHLPRSYRTR